MKPISFRLDAQTLRDLDTLATWLDGQPDRRQQLRQETAEGEHAPTGRTTRSDALRLAVRLALRKLVKQPVS